MNIGEVIVYLRKQSGVKQKELATHVGITATYLGMIEKNQSKASMTLLSKIAAYFNLPLNALLFKAIDVDNIQNAEKSRYFKAATPIVDKIINYIISGNTSMEKDSMGNSKVRTHLRKSTTRLKV